MSSTASLPASSLPRPASPARLTKPDPATLASGGLPRLDSATSTSTSALPPTTPPPSDSAADATDKTNSASSRQRQRQRQRQPRTARMASPPPNASTGSTAAHVSSDNDSDLETLLDFATERDRLLANHGLSASDTSPLLGGGGDQGSSQTLSSATATRVAVHRQARRQGMRTSGRASQRTEFHTPLPWRALTLTVFLFSFGSIALSTSAYLFLGYGHTKDPDKWQPLAILGTLCMIPGGFYMWHFLMVALGVPGWSYDDIPEL